MRTQASSRPLSFCPFKSGKFGDELCLFLFFFLFFFCFCFFVVVVFSMAQFANRRFFYICMALDGFVILRVSAFLFFRYFHLFFRKSSFDRAQCKKKEKKKEKKQ